MSQLPSVPPTSPGDALDIPFPLSTTVGALEIGVLFGVFLFGVLTVQMYIYFDRFPNDPTSFKFMVGLGWILDCGHTISICHFIYIITVTQYGQPALLAIPPKSLDASILLSGLIGPLEQGWFTYRLHRFTKTLPLPLICVILSLLRVGGSIALFAFSFMEPTIQGYDTRVMWIIEAVVIVGAAVDVILAVALCYYLSFWRTGGFRRTNKLVNQLMTWAIETGAITSAGALAIFISFLTMKDNLVYIGFFCMMAKLFSNSLLFSLNARERFAHICAQALSIAVSEHSATQLVSPRSFELRPFSDVSKWQHTTLRIRTDLDPPSSPANRPQSSVTFGSSPVSVQAHNNFLP
ncbi:hypothetical protein B0H19DRAFT_1271095 [Mycena capillaripes]|nr:hypothetical protein B0H19DRAFT_1271095 [Mycena capillaripes]